jgi:hypothetical protein
MATTNKTFLAGVACCMVALGACGNFAGGSGEPTQSARSSYPITPSVSAAAVLLDFDNENPLATSAAEHVSVRSLEAGGGQAVQVQSGNGTSALRFPPFAAGKEAPRLIIVLSPVGDPDPLNPEGKDFSFGADLRLSDASSGEAAKERDDNGDNVLQRGLFSDANQYKLQVDKGVPSCTVKSGEARLFVEFDQALDDEWFRVRCDYAAGSLTVSVSRIHSDRVEELGRKTKSMSIESLGFSKTTPASIGGKIGANGELVLNDSDQFNGELDNVFVDIPPSAG